MKFSIHIFSSLLHRDFHSLHLRWYELPSWGGGGRILFNSSDSFVGRYGEHVLLSYFLISPVSQVLPSNPPSSQSSLLDPKDWSG